MYEKIIKAILIFMVSFTLSAAAGLAFSAFSFYHGVSVSLSDIYALMKNRAESTGEVLSKIAGEDYPESYVLLSESMRELVTDSERSGDSLQIEEAFLIDISGKITAHNDVSYVAESSEKGYRTTPEYISGRNRGQRDAVSIRILREISPPGDIKDMPAYYFIQKTEPELLAEAYHVSVAVFPVDGISPTGILHLHFRNRFIETFFQRLSREFRSSVIYTFAAATGAGILFTFLSFRMGGRSLKQKPDEVIISREPEEPVAAEILLPHREPEPEEVTISEELPDYSLSEETDQFIDLSEDSDLIDIKPGDPNPPRSLPVPARTHRERIADAIPLRAVK